MLGLLAAAAHDVDHPGVNQPFLIKTNHHLANLYQVKLKNKPNEPAQSLGAQLELFLPSKTTLTEGIRTGLSLEG